MKKYYFFLLLLTINTFHAQNKVFENFDFNSGEYALVGTFSESDKNSLRDSLKEFYTTDTTILNEFKKEWVFEKPGNMYACGYHYTIYLFKNKKVVKKIRINLECEEIVFENNYFYFDSNKLRRFYGKLDRVIKRDHHLSSVYDSRKLSDSLMKESKLLGIPDYDWQKYEGYFQFEYFMSKKEKRVYYKNEDKAMGLIEEELKGLFPNELFEINDSGGSLESVIVEVSCNQSMFSKFYVYKQGIETEFTRWEPNDAKFTSFWK